MRRVSLGLSLCAAVLRAQAPATGSLAGRIVGNESGSPLPYGIVAVPELGTERFTNDSGSFLLTGLRPGPVEIRVRRLGYAPMNVTFPVRAGVTDTIRIALNRIAVRLARVEVRELPLCHLPGAPDPAKDSALATVYAQLRLNAQQLRTLSEAYPFEYSMKISLSRTLPNGKLREDGTEISRSFSKREWRYEPGRVVTRARETRKYGPLVFNIPSLLDFADEAFVKNHCFHSGGVVDVDGSELLKVDVVAAERIRWPDVDGSIFLDPGTFQIKRTVLRMSRMPRSSQVRGMTGMEVTTLYREVLPSIPVLEHVSSVQRFDRRTPGLSHVAAYERQELIAFRFLDRKPGEDTRP